MGCRAKSAVNVLVRIASDETGHLQLGRGRTGRGAWVHADSPACVARALERRALQRALRREFSDEELDELRVRLGQRSERGEGVGG